MKKRSFTWFIIIMSVSLAGLIGLQSFWMIESFQREQDTYDRLLNVAVRQMDGMLLNYLSPDYIPESPLSILDQDVPSNEIQKIPRRMSASQLLGYYRDGNDSLPVYGPKYVNTEITLFHIDSIINHVLTELDLGRSYRFGVYEKRSDTLVYGLGDLTGIRTARDMKSFNLLNPNAPANHQLVRFDIPHRTGQIFGRVKWLFTFNVLLLFLIVSSFIYALQIIVRQKKIQKIRRDFISNLTHEFKTPVSTVSLALEGLSNYPLDDKPEQRDRFLSMARRENQRLGLMIERTLNIAAFEGKSISIEKEKLNIHELILKVIENFEIHIQHREGNLFTDLRAELFYVNGDPDHLVQVFYNLLDNSVKYSSESPMVEVLTKNTTTNWISIEVKDQGKGIDNKRITDIFAPFNRGKQPKEEHIKGFGLGLAYVKHIIELHHGTVEVESVLEEGSCFTIKLPCFE